MAHYDYIIADLRLRSDLRLTELGLRNFEPFEVTTPCDKADCTLSFVENIDTSKQLNIKELYHSHLEESNSDNHLYRVDNGYLYSVKPCDGESPATLFHLDTATWHITTSATENNPAVLSFGIWMMFGIVLAHNNAIAIHSSCVVNSDLGVLFLGESGTGKSTHTRLWLNHIEDTALLNDDSPIVRIKGSEIRVYGSPWSGKKPCYKAESYPVKSFCRLSQAPHNRIKRLPTIAALGALLPSTPPQYAHDGELQDAILSTLSTILRRVGVYHLECLPDADAAYVAHKTMILDAEGIG